MSKTDERTYAELEAAVLAGEAITAVNAHVIPQACAHVIPQVVGPR